MRSILSGSHFSSAKNFRIPPLHVLKSASSSSTIAVAAVLEGKREDFCGQRCFIVRCRRNLALRRSMLTQNPARPSFGNAKFSHNMINAGAAACGA
jgi:hypothetical protein